MTRPVPPYPIGQAIAHAQQQYPTLDPIDLQYALLHVLGINLAYLRCHPENLFNDAQYTAWQQVLSRLNQQEPLAYILEEKEFWGLTLTVSPATLIPRPDTECLVETAIHAFADQRNNPDFINKKINVLDLGTGTGAIALAIAHERPHWHVTATDFSTAALEIAQHNAARNNLNQVVFLQGSWFDALHGIQPVPQFDLIVSNPPYIDPADAHLSALRYEPISALVAAEHGLADLRHIINGASQWLKSQGLLMLEHGYDQANAVRDLMQQAGLMNVHSLRDYGGNERVSLGQMAT